MFERKYHKIKFVKQNKPVSKLFLFKFTLLNTHLKIFKMIHTNKEKNVHTTFPR